MASHRVVRQLPSPASSLSNDKADRLRSSWFILGTFFGVLLVGLYIAIMPKQDTLVAAPEQMTPPGPVSIDMEVRPGDTLLSMLTDSGVSRDEAHNVVDSLRKVYNPRRLNVGQNLSLSLDKSEEKPSVESLAIAISPITSIELYRDAQGEFQVSKVEQPTITKQVRGGGKIMSSLYETGIAAGLSPSMLHEIIAAYSYDVDFQRDIQPGTAFDVVFERYETESGERAGAGNVLYTELDVGGKKLRLYRYEDKDGNVEFFNEKGQSNKKTLLQTPINGARISSGFGVRRHPVLGYSKMHKGVDFAARTGTPIYAAGDGVVAEAGRKGSYGNYVRIKHTGTYSTAYAHASRIAAGIRAGKRVKQGQVIAYVGTTGRSTGPHLHYEVLVSNRQVNPKSIKFPSGRTLAGRELADFKNKIAAVNQLLASLPMGGEQKLAAAVTVDSTKTN